MFDVEAYPKPATADGYDSQTVAYEPSSDNDDPASEEGAKSGPATKPPSPIRPFTQRKSRRGLRMRIRYHRHLDVYAAWRHKLKLS
ncbi:hypothetical protein Pcac1_g28645 [Phytophthora cactorum]|nr:hypothetical protein Pcac1_g28645 [Phytophthora cactorum]